MNIDDLKKPFEANDIEWRLQSCGEKNGKIWGLCLAYVTNRAIQMRLDEVCGPLSWKNEYKSGPEGGVICGISIYDDDKKEWVTKWDGAENTDIEKIKGGLSNSMKRSAVQWGIGRYLYNLEATFINEDKNGKYKGATKEKKYFKWNPPLLPVWALPDDKAEEKKVNKKKRAELNKLLMECKSERDYYDTVMGWADSKNTIWYTLTYHNEFETFSMLAKEHHTRIMNPNNPKTLPSLQEEFKGLLESISDDVGLEQAEEYISTYKILDTPENNSEIAKLKVELGGV